MPVKWYHTWWGVVLISFCILAVAGGLMFVGTVAKYWWQIRHGETPAFLSTNTASFTVSGQSSLAKVNRAELETVDSPWLGRYGAPITIVEFFDFKCPNCKIEAPILRQIDALFHNKVRIIMRHFPPSDPSFHPGAMELAHIGYCASKLNPASFWVLYDYLYQNQDNLPVPLDNASITNLASIAALDETKLRSCMTASATNAAVTKDYLTGVSAGVRGTPTFFINGEKVEGAVSLDTWKKFLDAQ